MRDHQPIVIADFNGLWARGDEESCPLDHFTDCSNIIGIHSGFQTRNGMQIHEVAGSTNGLMRPIKRHYTYNQFNQQGILALDTLGNIYHTLSPTPTVPILTIPAMTDFAFVNIAGRAYLSPHDGFSGLQNEFVYVYLGTGNLARKAAGFGPVGGGMAAAISGGGNVERGIHIFGVVYETDTGFLTKIGPTPPFPFLDVPGGQSLNITGIPTSPNTYVVARRLVATKAINPNDFTGDTTNYQFFFIPGARIPDNTTTSLVVSFFDAELLEDASHLLDLFEEIPAGVNLNTYHNRMLVVAPYGQFNVDPTLDESGLISTCYVSYPGEPEAIDQVSGLIIAPLDGNPLTNAQEYRDVLYLFKKTRTLSYVDNGDVPSSWPLTIIDQGLGASIHGIAAVLDSGGINIEFLLVMNFFGVIQFNGAYNRPEITWKIKDLWYNLDRNEFKNMQIMNDSLTQWLYINLPDKTLLVCDYTNGLNAKDVKWWPWKFPNKVDTITLINNDRLVIGSTGLMP